MSESVQYKLEWLQRQINSIRIGAPVGAAPTPTDTSLLVPYIDGNKDVQLGKYNLFAGNVTAVNTSRGKYLLGDQSVTSPKHIVTYTGLVPSSIVVDHFEYSSDALAKAAYISQLSGTDTSTGGIIVTDANGTTHTFTTPGAFIAGFAMLAKTLAIGAGAGGGGRGGDGNAPYGGVTGSFGGGGSGGECARVDTALVKDGTITVTGIGTSGTNGIKGAQGFAGSNGTSGANTVTSVVTALGGNPGSGGNPQTSPADPAPGTPGTGLSNNSGGFWVSNLGGGGGSATAPGPGINEYPPFTNGNGNVFPTGGPVGDSHSTPPDPNSGRGGGTDNGLGAQLPGSGVAKVWHKLPPTVVVSSDNSAHTGSYCVMLTSTLDAYNPKGTAIRYLTGSNILNLSGEQSATVWVKSNRIGSGAQVSLVNADGTTSTSQAVTFAAANTWQQLVWDISAIPNSQKNAIVEVHITSIDDGTYTTFATFFDEFLTTGTGTVNYVGTFTEDSTGTVLDTGLSVSGYLRSTYLTANRATVTDALSRIVSSPTTDVELSYVHNVTSPIQTQINWLTNHLPTTIAPVTSNYLTGYDSTTHTFTAAQPGITDITGLTTALAGKEPTITAGTTSNYWRGDKTWAAFPSLSGYVVGPASAVNGNVALFDTTTGKLIKDGGTLGSAAFVATGTFDAAGTASSAVSSHAALLTGIHGLAITAAQTLTVTSSTTLGGGSTSGTNTGDNAANSSTMYIGTTAVALNRGSSALVLTGITSIDGSSASCVGNSATASASTNLIGGNSTTLLGAIPYQSNINSTTLLGPNISSTKKFLRMTGTGTNGAAPVWDAVTSTDIGLGSVENTALSTWAGTTNITTLGTIGTGTWNATAIADGKIASALTGKTYNGMTVTSTTGTFTLASSSSLITSGAYSTTLTSTGTTNVTLPTTGTLAILGANTFTDAQQISKTFTADTTLLTLTNVGNGNGGTPSSTNFDFKVANSTVVSRIKSEYTQNTGLADLVFYTYSAGLNEKMRIASTGAVTIPGTLGATGVITGNNGIVTNGAASYHLAGSSRMDYTTGYGRLIVEGPDTSTVGGLIVYLAKSDGSGLITGLQITPSGAVSVPNALSAGAVTATSINFGGSTLSNYTTATAWTPAIKFGGNNVGMAGTTAGSYTRIGNIVYVSLTFTLTAKGSSTGLMTIESFPLTPVSGGSVAVAIGYYVGLPSSYTPSAYTGGGSGIIYPCKIGGATLANNLTDADISNTTRMDFSYVLVL